MIKTVYLAGGCFWGVEKYVLLIRGVIGTNVGYANGNTVGAPTYEDVRYRESGHAETVRVDYDPIVLPLGELLRIFFAAIDPYSVNRQGEDEGTQYRAGVYYTDESDLPEIGAAIERLENDGGRKCAVEIAPLAHYYEAEEYHQKYLQKNPSGYCHIGICPIE